MESLHEVTDTGKVDALVSAIERNGWQGAPMVADGEQLITGVHRYAAMRRLGYADSDMAIVDVRDLFAAGGLDYDALMANNDADLDWWEALLATLAELSTAVRDEYGIDCH